MKRRNVLQMLGVAPFFPFFIKRKKYEFIELRPKHVFAERDQNDLVARKYCYYKISNNSYVVSYFKVNMEWGEVPTKKFLENANNYKYLYKVLEDPFFGYVASNEKIEETDPWIMFVPYLYFGEINVL